MKIINIIMGFLAIFVIVVTSIFLFLHGELATRCFVVFMLLVMTLVARNVFPRKPVPRKKQRHVEPQKPARKQKLRSVVVFAAHVCLCAAAMIAALATQRFSEQTVMAGIIAMGASVVVFQALNSGRMVVNTSVLYSNDKSFWIHLCLLEMVYILIVLSMVLNFNSHD